MAIRVKKKARGPRGALIGIGRVSAIVGLPYVGWLALLAGLRMVAPQAEGALALAQVFAPHFYLPALTLGLPALFPRAWAARLALAGAAALFGAQFLPGMVPEGPGGAEGTPLRVVSWNAYGFNRDGARVAARLREARADVIGLQEVHFAHVAAIEEDAVLEAAYPWRELRPSRSVHGIGILSAHPIEEHETFAGPPALRARLDLGEGRRLTVVVAHPFPPLFDEDRTGPLPVGYSTAGRDAEIARVLALAEPARARGEPVLVIGDFNVTDREPAYRALVDGFTDAHAAAGWGTGSSWKGPLLVWAPLALIRIDYLLAGPGVAPRAMDVDCRPTGSDHCVLSGEFAVRW
jgi:endonuclease/exonuclease/phosphatase family metal-dependent hydrolase